MTIDDPAECPKNPHLGAKQYDRHHAGTCASEGNLAMTDSASDRYVVISSDGHAGADLLDYRPYLEKEFHDEFDTWAEGFTEPWAEYDKELADTDDPNIRLGVASASSLYNWDSNKRLEHLDAEGICAEVLFPNTVPPFYPSGPVTAPAPSTPEEYRHRRAGVRAHNRWMVDFCAEAPGRRTSPIQIFLYDIDDALAEIRWGHAAGLSAVLVPAVAPNHVLEGLWSKRYDPIWALCEELGLPVNQHVGAGTPDLGQDPAEGATFMYEVYWYARRSLWAMLFGGVFERFADLRFVMTEEGLGWVLPELARLEYYVVNARNPHLAQSFGHEAIAALRLTPTEYFQRNCVIGASSCQPAEIGCRYDVGVERIMWGADYPHPEGTMPFTTEALRATFAQVPVAECRAMFGENAARVYGFDLAALRPVADRIGPRVAEISQPLDAYPADSLFPVYLGPLHPQPGTFVGYTGSAVAV
jgi:predicted TIM-barrel fold metal-dependent hydrolase